MLAFEEDCDCDGTGGTGRGVGRGLLIEGETAIIGENGVGVAGISRAVLAASATPVAGAGESLPDPEREFDRERPLTALIFAVAAFGTLPCGTIGNEVEDEEADDEPSPFGLAMTMGGIGLDGAGSRGGGFDEGKGWPGLRLNLEGPPLFSELVLTPATDVELEPAVEEPAAADPPKVVTEG